MLKTGLIASLALGAVFFGFGILVCGNLGSHQKSSVKIDRPTAGKTLKNELKNSTASASSFGNQKATLAWQSSAQPSGKLAETKAFVAPEPAWESRRPSLSSSSPTPQNSSRTAAPSISQTLPAATSASVSARDASIQQVDSTAPGNSFWVGSQRVSVESVQTSPGTTALDVGISETESAATTDTVPDQFASSTTSGSSGLPRYRRSQLQNGFTYEEQLFRSKWGWNAFNEAQKTALQSGQ